jgi:TonB family protein
MGAPIQAARAASFVGCVLIAGCVTERFQPAAALPSSFGSGNPCERLQPVRNARPSYPQHAARQEQQGWVALKYHVAANGDVFNVRVVASSPQGMFEDVSAAALTGRRYEPVTYPIANCMHVYVYTLGTEKAPAPATMDGSFAAFEKISAGKER